MKTILILAAFSMLCGCTKLSIERKGTDVKFNAIGLFQNSAMSKLAVDVKTPSGTYSGLKIGALENDTNVEAMKALGEVLGAAAATAARKAVVP